MISKPIKVCHFTSTHSPKDQRIFHKECVSLAKKGYDVTLVEQGNSEESQDVHIVGTGEKNEGRYYRLIVRPHAVYRLAKKIDADIYHFHDMELIPYGLKLKRAGKIVVFDYHEDYAMRFADSDALTGPALLKNLLANIYTAYERHALRRFDALISVTPHICERLEKSNPNTVMVTNYPMAENAQWRVDSSYHSDSDYVVFTGQISNIYRLKHIVECIQNIPGVKLKLCGPIRKKEEFEDILTADINSQVEYLGVLPYMQVPEIIKKSRAALVLNEDGPNTAGHVGTLGINKLFEYMLCGVPVICSDFDLWKEIIEGHKCGICVDSYSKDELKNAICEIFQNPEMAGIMGCNGKQAVQSKYNWHMQEEILFKLYDKLIEDHRKKK